MSRLTCIFLLCLLTATVNGQPANHSSVSRKAAMNKVDPKLMELTTLPAEVYFSEDQQTFFNLQMRVNQELAARPAPEKEILLINGVTSLDLDRRNDLPALLIRYATGMRNWKVSNGLNSFLVSQDLDNGHLKVQSLAEKGEERIQTPEPSASGTPPDANTAESTGTSLRRYFLRRLMSVDWRPSRLAFTMMDYDVSSNTHQVTLTKGSQPPPKPVLPVVAPSGFVKAMTAPASMGPATERVELSVASSSAQQVVMHGHIQAAASGVPAAQSSTAARRADVILATLVLVALDQPPLPVSLAIPATVLGEPGSGQQLAADFSFDLVPLLGRLRRAGIVQVYLFAGLQTFGPVAVKVGG